jgi:uncharacterized membrane protein
LTGTFNALIAATLFFVGGHFLLSSLFLRQPLVRRLGERNFRIFYSVLMLVAFAWMVKAYGQAPYLVIWHPPEVLRWVPVAILPFACLFLVAGLSTPGVTAVGGEKLLEEDPRAAARGIYSITRHPTLWAFGLWALSHLAVRGDFSSICMMGGIAFLSFFRPAPGGGFGGGLGPCPAYHQQAPLRRHPHQTLPLRPQGHRRLAHRRGGDSLRRTSLRARYGHRGGRPAPIERAGEPPMPTHADVAAKLLRDAASFFQIVGEQNPAVSDEMKINAKTFRAIANLVESDPQGECVFVDPVAGDGED